MVNTIGIAAMFAKDLHQAQSNRNAPFAASPLRKIAFSLITLIIASNAGSTSAKAQTSIDFNRSFLSRFAMESPTFAFDQSVSASNPDAPN